MNGGKTSQLLGERAKLVLRKTGEKKMEKKTLIGSFIISCLLAGCSYAVQPAATRAINIYSNYDDKIGGNYSIILDESIRNIQRDIAPSTHICGAHRYPIVIGDSLAISVKHALDSIFESAVENSADRNLTGTILIRLDDFSSKLTCTQGWGSATCSASTDISFGVSVRGSSGYLFNSAVMGSRTADGPSGGACAGGANVIADSISRSTRDALERLAERVSNSPKIRGAVTQTPAMQIKPAVVKEAVQE